MNRTARHGFALSLLGSALLAALPFASQAQDAAVPSYSAEPCCQLCPQAANPDLYPKGFMSNFKHLVQGQDNWLFRTDVDLMTNFDVPPQGVAQLKRLNEALKAKGVQLVIVYQPTRGLVHPNRLTPAERARFNYEAAQASYKRTLADFHRLGIVAPDLSPLLNEPVDTDHPYFFMGDHHWTPFGAERTAKLVAAELMKMPVMQDIPEAKFVTRPDGVLGKHGTLQKAALQICGTGYGDQYVQRFTTEPANVASGDDLFGDDSTAQIVLIGTSNSGEALNFNGFLQQNLSRKIENQSVIGGGLDGSMVQYLASDEFRQHPPKVIIWEFAAYNNLAQMDFYREAVPLAVANGCAQEKPALVRKDYTLGSGRNDVLVNTSAADMASGRYLLDLKFSDPGVKTLHGTVWYMTGKKEQFKVERSPAMDTQGRFVLELRDDGDYRDLNVLGVDVDLPEGSAPGKTKVTAELCQRQSPSVNNVASAQ
jgi:alginate biosynthesis protein AlgX